MKMFYFLFDVRPKPGTKEAVESGGAFVNCWIQRQTENEASERARFMLEGNNWIINELQESREVDEDYYLDDSEGMEYYKQALTDGEVLVINSYPLEAQE